MQDDRPRCAAEGCDKPQLARQLCRRHYHEDLAAGKRCIVDGCPRPPWSSGYCSTHYHRVRKYGDAGEAELRRKPTRPCKVEGCANTAKTSADLCPTHARRKRIYSDELGLFRTHKKCVTCDGPAVSAPRTGDYCREHYVAHIKGLIVRGELVGARNPAGYVYHSVFKTKLAEHRVVMESILGRPLLTEEEPHHRNGVRHDNRPENLELWSTSQPRGQRVVDKVEWAVELLQLYAPELLADRPVQLRLIT